jgi:hypothetical protein
MSTQRHLVMAALVALGAAGMGCKDPAREETRSLVEAVSRFRLSTDAEKHARITDIQSVRCTVKTVCDARDTCLRMAEEYDHSLQLRVQVKDTLKEIEQKTLSKDDPRAQALPALLDESEASLNKSHALGRTCDEQVSGLTRSPH